MWRRATSGGTSVAAIRGVGGLMSLVAGGPRTASPHARLAGSALERRAYAHRQLLEAEVRLQTGGERDEEAIVPLATGLLSDILGGDPAIICYTFEDEITITGHRELRLRWRYGYEPRDQRPGPTVAAVPLLLDGDIAAHTARARAARLWQPAEGDDPAAFVASEEVRGGAEARARFSILSVPILADDALLGVINAYRPAVLPFDEDDRAAAVIFAGGVGVALRNARLNARLVETEARARDLVEQSPDTIIVHTAEGRLLEANAAAGGKGRPAPPQLGGAHLD